MNIWLLLAALINAAIALLHVYIIYKGAPAYRFFGAGEQMAKAAETGSWMPAIVTTGITLVFALWAAFALAGARVIPALPLERAALVTIAVIYVLRGLPVLAVPFRRVDAFWLVTSLVSLLAGVLHALGAWQAWKVLG